MSAIFISYTGRDPEGDAWADRLAAWFTEWNYGYFRDKDHSHGVKAGDDWRQTLYGELGDATAMVCLCSQQYDSSPWCVGEVAIAVEKGKTVIPIQLAKTAEEIKREPLPLLLQTKQAIMVADATAPSPEQLAEVKRRLQATLQEKLNWRDLQHWDRSLAPYPGLPALEAHQAPVFFGRDTAIKAVCERVAGMALRTKAFLLLLGASGYGKSSLVRAGVVPRLKGVGEGSWTVLPPFTPGDEPFKELEAAVAAAGGVFDPSDPLSSLQKLQRRTKAPVLLVIDQFEELLTAGPTDGGTEDQGELFQVFLKNLLRARKAGLMVLATMRTDFLAPLQTRWPTLTGMASTYTLEPIEPEDFGVLITGPAKRANLTLESGLEARLVKESGGRDALPLLAFTLEKLWKARKDQCLTVKDYMDLGGVEGAVSTRARECWDPQTSSEEVRKALREAFLDHLVSVGGDGREAKRPAPLAELPLASREIVQRMVDDRLLVLKEGIVEIAHEALLRTWEPLVQWIEEGKEDLLQCLRAKRMSDDLKPEASERQRRQAMEQLTAMAATGGSEERAVQKEATDILTKLLVTETYPVAEREDATFVLGLVGEENVLTQCLADATMPVDLRRMAAESLGLLARRSAYGQQRRRIEQLLEYWLRNAQLNLLVMNAEGWAEHDARLPLLQGASRGLNLAASAELPLLSSGRSRVVPALTLSALEERGGLKITTDIVEVPIWMIPLPNGEHLEFVLVPGGIYDVGSPTDEVGRNQYDLPRMMANPDDPETPRSVVIDSFYIMRYPVTQSQWRAVATEQQAPLERKLDEMPGKAIPISNAERHAYHGMLAIESVNWNDAVDWISRLNAWLAVNWAFYSPNSSFPRLSLPNDCQWEAACRGKTLTPFHFGDTLDPSWARFRSDDAPYGIGRNGAKPRQVGIVGENGLYNKFGLADMHGQVAEWCDEFIHNEISVAESLDPQTSRRAIEPSSRSSCEKSYDGYRLTLGGCFIYRPMYARSACKLRQRCAFDGTDVGIRLVVSTG